MQNIGKNLKGMVDIIIAQFNSDMFRLRVSQMVQDMMDGKLPLEMNLKTTVNVLLEDRGACRGTTKIRCADWSRGKDHFADFAEASIDNAQPELEFKENSETDSSDRNARFGKMISQKRLDALTNLTSLDLMDMTTEEIQVAYMALASKILLENFGVFYAIFFDEEGRCYIFRWYDCEEPTIREIERDIMEKTRLALLDQNAILYSAPECQKNCVSTAEHNTEEMLKEEGKVAGVTPTLNYPIGIRDGYCLMSKSHFFPRYINVTWLFEK